MGAADLVPGISGGTVALISGIYDTFIESLGRCNLTAIKKLISEGPGAFWHYIRGSFLLTLFAGIVTSLITLSRLIAWILLQHPVPAWSFFFGLVLASGFVLSRSLHLTREYKSGAIFLLGAMLSSVLATSTPFTAHDTTPVSFFLAGAVAVCAMMLPGISGSFVLTLLGYYIPVMHAVAQLQLSVLTPLALGCLTGLIVFSRLLIALLHKARQLTMAFLTGAILGSLTKLWPWQQSLPAAPHSSADTLWLWPWQYTAATGNPAMPAAALMAAAAGFALVWGLERWARPD